MCEMAANLEARDSRSFLTAWRYFEEIEPPKLGHENQNVRRAALELIDDEAGVTAGSEIEVERL
jgi:hypothetical protein